MLGFYTFAGPWVISVSRPLGNEISQGPCYVNFLTIFVGLLRIYALWIGLNPLYKGNQICLTAFWNSRDDVKSIKDIFLQFETIGFFSRINEEVWPTAFKCATVSKGQLIWEWLWCLQKPNAKIGWISPLELK